MEDIDMLVFMKRPGSQWHGFGQRPLLQRICVPVSQSAVLAIVLSCRCRHICQENRFPPNVKNGVLESNLYS